MEYLTTVAKQRFYLIFFGNFSRDPDIFVVI